MGDRLILGLFHEATPTADTIDALRALGVPDERITVLTGVPYRPEILGREAKYENLAPIAIIGAISGLLIALFLVVGTPLLYPIHVGGQPIIPIPPSIIIIFEFTIGGTMVATFAGLLAVSRFPLFGRRVYDERITEGHIGVLTRVDESLQPQVEEALKARGAHHMKVIEAQQRVSTRPWLRWVFLVVFLFIPITVGLLFAYAIIAVPIPDQMVTQSSIGYQEGPRLSAPNEAVPIQGSDLVAGLPASQPLPATND
jgi:hypothetical protein